MNNQFLLRDIKYLKGVGPILARLLANLDIITVFDLLLHLPHTYLRRRFIISVREGKHEEACVIKLKVNLHCPPPKGSRKPYRVICADSKNKLLHLIFFHNHEKMLKIKLPETAEVVVCGKLEFYRDAPQIAHPEYIIPASEFMAMKGIQPVYPLTGNISNNKMYSLIKAALPESETKTGEWIEPSQLNAKKWPDFSEALRLAHMPEEDEYPEKVNAARARLAYDEILAHQLVLQFIRAAREREQGFTINHKFTLAKRVMELLPYELTESQRGALREISADLKSGLRMARLLQGDVGSGKTIVALLAATLVIEQGRQAAMMSPISILARQQFETVNAICAEVGIACISLTGADKGKERERKLAKIAAGEVQLVVGTHALFNEKVVFNNLGLAVVDEQHRFGVRQRMALSGKGSPHVLMMTATPIPRSLCMAAFGDMDSSTIPHKPAGRKPIKTSAISLSRLPEVIDSILRACVAGGQAYWICPLVEESEELDLSAAVKRYEDFKERIGAKAGLIHGKMPQSERENVMERFTGGEVKVLVATTVIEVGVSVPNATAIVIEHAERFGLSQLHQLRGRVGRSEKESACILLYGKALSQAGKQRLRIMRETNDGFLIAEEDLKIRGAGEVIGTRQSGAASLKLSNPVDDADSYIAANADAKLLLHNDPKLESPRGLAARQLLQLFKLDSYADYLKA